MTVLVNWARSSALWYSRSGLKKSLLAPVESVLKKTLFYSFNKLTSVFHASLLLLIMNFFMTLSKQPWIDAAIAQQIRRLMKNWPGVNWLLTTNCQPVCSRSVTHRINYEFMCLSTYWKWKLSQKICNLGPGLSLLCLPCVVRKTLVAASLDDHLWQNNFHWGRVRD